MKPFDFRKLLIWSALAVAVVGSWLRADEPPTPPPEPAAPSAPAAPTPPDKPSDAKATDDQQTPAKDAADVSEPTKSDEAAPASTESPDKPAHGAKRSRRSGPGRPDDDQVIVGDDNHILAGIVVPHNAVAVMGDLTIDGEVLHDAVAVMGDNTINGHVHHSVVAIMGDIVLGPKAVVDGDLVCVGGEIKRDPGATVGGRVTVSGIGPKLRSDSFGNWWDHGLKVGRPLAIGAHLGWLWIITGFSIAFYALLGLVFPARISACGEKLVQEPAQVLLAAILAVLALPVLFVLLCITIIGIPIALLVLPVTCLFMAMFGKAAIYALIGRKLTNDRFHPAIAVIIGALLAVLLYLVPILGLLLSLVVWFLGFGCAVLLMFGKPKPAPAAPVVSPPPPFVPPASAAGPTENFTPPVSPSPVASVVMEPPPIAAAAPLSGASVVAAMVVTADTMPRAGFWIRVGAALLDFLMLVVPIGVLGAFDHGPGLFFLLLAGYHASMWKFKGTTIGGIICGLKVVRLDDRPLDWGVTVVRALSAFLSIFVAGLGFIWVAFDDEKQSWHDKVAGTTIVRVPKGTSLL